MKHFDYFAPTEIIFGAGRVTEAGALAARYGKKAMLVTVPEFPAVAELYAKVKKSLSDAGVACVHYDGVIPNPTTELVTRGPELAKAEAYDSFQFVRNGYFCVDCKDSTPEHLVFNRIVSLKSSFKLNK